MCHQPVRQAEPQRTIQQQHRSILRLLVIHYVRMTVYHLNETYILSYYLFLLTTNRIMNIAPTAHWTFNGTFTERLKGWTLKEMVGNVSFTSDRNRRANSALSLTKGYIMTSNCPTPYTVLSAALWVYVISVPSDYMGMFYWRTYYGGNIFFIDNKIAFNLLTSELFIMRYNGSLINNNIWTHVGFTLDCLDQGCNVNLYLNGHVTFIDKLQLPITQLDYGTCYIGGNQYGWKFNGYIDDLMAWNKTLTPTEMIAVKNDYL